MKLKTNLIAWVQQLPDHEKRLTFSTALTIGRMALIPVLIATIVAQWWISSMVLLAIAAITDVLDGFLARLFNEQTLLGALLDPLADKLCTIGSFSALAYIQRIPSWFFVLALIKEVLQIIGAGSFVYRFHESVKIQATVLGKAAMVGQTILISWVLYSELFSLLPNLIEYWLLFCVSILMISSLFYYAYIGLQYYLWGPQYE